MTLGCVRESVYALSDKQALERGELNYRNSSAATSSFGQASIPRTMMGGENQLTPTGCPLSSKCTLHTLKINQNATILSLRRGKWGGGLERPFSG